MSDGKTLPSGNYTLVGVDIDTTGRRLIDEIVHLAAFTPEEQFSQYIMPYMNLNPAARQRHQVRVITIGFYRMLKSMQTYKVLKTKSEVQALKEFIEWLEELAKKTSATDGLILVYHEQRKFIPYLLLEALKKYSLMDRFNQTVKSFVNGFELAEKKTGQSCTLRNLMKQYFGQEKENKDDFEGNASVRARQAFEIQREIANQESKIAPLTLIDHVLTAARPVQTDLNELDEQNSCLERQNSLRPIFLQYFKTTLYYRVKGVNFRRILAEHGFDFNTLLKIWNLEKRSGVQHVIDKIEILKPNEKAELVELLDSHFDPDKLPIKPVIKKSKRRLSRKGRNKENLRPNHGGGDTDCGLSPDTTNRKSPIKSKKDAGRFSQTIAPVDLMVSSL